jgi:hypothetical protein
MIFLFDQVKFDLPTHAPEFESRNDKSRFEHEDENRIGSLKTFVALPQSRKIIILVHFFPPKTSLNILGTKQPTNSSYKRSIYMSNPCNYIEFY